MALFKNTAGAPLVVVPASANHNIELCGRVNEVFICLDDKASISPWKFGHIYEVLWLRIDHNDWMPETIIAYCQYHYRYTISSYTGIRSRHCRPTPLPTPWV